jgi:Domain of unknown function (DUF4191)
MARKDKQQSGVPSGTEKKPGRIAQMRQVFTATRRLDPLIGWYMLLAAIATLVVVIGIGVLVGHWMYATILAVPTATLAAVFVMSRRAERAAYGSIEGQPGATGAALSALRRGWYYSQEPVAADALRPTDMASAAMVFRALGRPGVVLLAEGPDPRARKLLEAERKKVARVAPGVPVTTLLVGDGEDRVPIRKVSSKLGRMKPVLTKEELAVVNKRLKSLGGIRLGMPAGVDPTKVRVDRKAMRGR